MEQVNAKLSLKLKHKGLVVQRMAAVTDKEMADFKIAVRSLGMYEWEFYRICVMALVYGDPLFEQFLIEYKQKLTKAGWKSRWIKASERNYNKTPLDKTSARKVLEQYGLSADALSIEAFRRLKRIDKASGQKFDIYEQFPVVPTVEPAEIDESYLE